MNIPKPADNPEWHQKEFLYTVLNLPTYASPSEIKERHRALSLIYHPDKQKNSDGSTTQTANKRFLEVQKAYEVLSDPFLRVVYDTLGYKGLQLKLPPHVRDVSLDELPSELYRISSAFHTSQLESRVDSRGRLIVGFDIRELFAGGWIWREWHKDLVERLGLCGLTAFSVRHSFQKEINSQTKVTLHGMMNHGVGDNIGDALGIQTKTSRRGNLVANVVHRHSSKITISASVPLLRRHRLTLTPTYSDGTNHIQLSTSIFPSSSLLFPYPPTNISLSRRLYKDSLTLGTVALTLNPLLPPAISIALNKPCIARLANPSPNSDSSRTSSAPKRHSNAGDFPLLSNGFSLSLNLRAFAPGPSIAYEHLILHPATNLRGKFGLEFSFMGPMTTLTGEWSNEEGTTSVSCVAGWGAGGVIARVAVSYLDQDIIIPLVLSATRDPKVQLITIVIPVACYALADYFFLRPKRAERRVARRNARRQAHSEHIQTKKREAEDTAQLLRENAKRHMQAEKNSDGLVILEATYLPLDESDEPISELGEDVTVILQSLVNNGQLYFPGNRPKSTLRGFFDPLPDFPKRLCIRYEFRGRLHYAEVGDWAPVVLPLEDHLVEDSLLRT